jgi:hypothetical protein
MRPCDYFEHVDYLNKVFTVSAIGRAAKEAGSVGALEMEEEHSHL